MDAVLAVAGQFHVDGADGLGETRVLDEFG